MYDRFYLPGPLDDPKLLLAGTEAHHLSQVLRLGPGARVVLFDGTGSEVTAQVIGVSKRNVSLEPCSEVRTTGRIVPTVTLAVAPPKGDRFRWLVEKATELNVTRLVPLITQRTVVDPREGKLDKLRQTVIAACKQSGRNHLMQITTPQRFQKSFPGTDGEDCRIMLHPGGTPLGTFALNPDREKTLQLLVGPEGGFTNEEVEQAVAGGATLASLGPTLLRTETAALAAAAIIASKWVR